MSRSRDVVRAGIPVAVTAGLLAWAVGTADRDALVARAGSLDAGWLLLAAALGPLQVVLAAERWRVACGRLGLPLDRRRAVPEVALSTLLAQVLPVGVAGDAVRAWRARDGGLPLAVRAVVVDRWIGLAVHLVAVAAGLLLGAPATPGVQGGVALVAAALAATGLALRQDLGRALGAPGPALVQVAASAAFTATLVAGFAACGHAVGAPLDGPALAAVPLVLLAMAVPVSVGGWGLREAAAAVVLPRVGVPADAAIAVSAAYGASALLGALPGAAVPWVRR